MINTVYLICGVPGAGKTWVCKQLVDKFEYIAHDDHLKDFVDVVIRRAKLASKPILTECPFGERLVKEKLEAARMYVVPIFITEDPDIIAQRYTARDGKPFLKAHATRAISIKQRALEWDAFHGSSEEVLKKLKEN